MKVAIIGAGAMGGLVGGFLSKGGSDVTMVDANPAVIDTLRANGLVTTVNGVTETHDVKVALHAGDIEPGQDLVVFLVKGQHTLSAVERYRDIISEDTWVMTLQNGVGHVEALQKALGRERVLYGPIQFPGRVIDAGHAGTQLTEYAGIHIGCTDNKVHPVMTEFAASAGSHEIFCDAVEHVDPHVWLKLRSNVRNAIFALLRLTVGELRMQEGGMDLLNMVSEEVDAVVRAKGLEYPGGPPSRDSGPKFGPDSPLMKHLPSTAEDVKAHRKTETEFLNGAVVREGRRLGVATPVNEFVQLSMKICENTYDVQF